MASITINGVDLGTDDVKAVNRAIRKARKDEARSEAERRASADKAQSLAEINAYKVLCRKANGLAQTWTYSPIGTGYATSVAKKVDDPSLPENTVDINYVSGNGCSATRFGLYGQSLLGIVHDTGGYVRGLFLKCRHDGDVKFLGFAAIGSEWHLADCPGITTDEFRGEDTPE